MKKFIALTISLLMLIPFAACGADGGEKGADGETIRFAVIGAMTGDAANTGIQQEWGVKLAVEEINSAGGINGKKLEYEVFDDQLVPNQAVICAEKIVADGDFEFVVSPISSGCTLAAYPTFDAAGLPVISATNTADHLTEQGFKGFLRICPTAGANLVQLVELAVEKYNVKNPAIFYTTSEIDTSSFETCKKMLEEKGIKIAASASVEAETEKDYNSHISNFKAAGADAIFCFSEYAPSSLFVKQQFALGFTAQQFSLSGTCNPQFIEIAGNEASEGFITMSAFDSTNPREQVQTFVQNYEKKSGIVPGEWGAGGYDTVYVAAEALKAGAGKADMVDWLRKNCNYQGVTGVISFDEKGDNPSAKALILQVKNGKYTVVQ